MKLIDISKYQGIVDFEKVKASGVEGVMIRAVSTNSGGIYIDPYFERNYVECKRVGLPCGVYYYTYAQSLSDANAELEMVKKALAGKTFELPVAVDVEENSLKPLSANALTDLVIHAVKAIESWGLYGMVYTYTYYQQTELNMARLAAYDLWIADYRGNRPSMPHGIWQHSSKGRVPGISGYVDINTGYKDYPAIIKAAGLTGGAGEPTRPAEPINTTKYIIATSECTGTDASALYTTLKDAADKLGNISVSKTEV